MPPSPDFSHRIQKYLEHSGIPHLQTSDLLSLNSLITDEEIEETIKSLLLLLSQRTRPRLPYEYYKTFLPVLLPHLRKLYNAFLQAHPFRHAALLPHLVS